MQFEMNHKVGTDYSTVTFSKVKLEALQNVGLVFLRLGGKRIEDSIPSLEDWVFTFPSFITSQVLEEVIHNTCFVCGGLMKDDYHEEMKDSIKYSTAIRKCISCGHSHT